ncbi:MAG: hypothetical protein K6F84_00540 [Lachnospiraceae bacterium]|nr:hypothetical protein [Lachnospiraceae bacterium]
MDLFKISEELYRYLIDAGISFTPQGYPIFTEEMLLKEIPEQVLPLGKTHVAKDKSKTLLVSFTNDAIIYKRLLSLKKDVQMYKEYLGFGGFDLSPRINWDINLQRFNIGLNLMADAFLALNGVKIMPNFRIGCLKTLDALNCYPSNTWYTVGALGCAKGHVKINVMYLRTKLIITNPDMLIYYGKLKTEYMAVLEEYGVPYKVYADYQRVSRRKEAM